MAKELNLGQLCDAIAVKEDEEAAAQAVVDSIKVEREALKDRLDILMRKESTTAAKGNVSSARRETRQLRRVKDWDAFYKALHRMRDGGYHLLQRRLADVPMRDLVEQRRGKELPGTEVFEQDRIVVTRNK